MRRREFILVLGGGTVAWPLITRAQQQAGKVWRIAWMNPGSMNTPSDHALLDVCRNELRKLGYVEDKKNLSLLTS